MKSSNNVVFPVVIIASLACSATAQVSQDETDLFELTLEELLNVRVVSSVSGIEQGLKSAPASASIILAKEWQSRGARTLSQALTGVAGLQSTLLASSNSERNVIIRGLSGSFGQQVKLLIDGVPFNRIHHGGKPALDIPLLGFKRIEIVRSPGSATYGADAFAGIINLISNDDFEQKTQAELAFGRFGQRDLGVQGSVQHEAVNFRYSVNYSKYQDDPERVINSDLQSVFDGIFNTNASRAPGRFDHSYEQVSVNLKAKWQNLSMSYYGLSGSFGFGAGVAEALDPEGRGKHNSHIVDAKYQWSMFDTDQTTVNLWWQEKHSEFPFTIFPAGAVLPIGSDGNLDFVAPTTLALFEQGYIGVPGNDSQLGQASITSVISPLQGHSLRWQLGIEYHKHSPFESKNFGPGVLNGNETVVTGKLTDVSGTPYAYLPEKSRNIAFFSVQDTWQLADDWALHIGGRYDDYSDFGSTINPRLGIVWQATNALTVKLLSATAYRAPSFYDRYADNNPVNLGNPELQPEEVDTNEFNLGLTVTDNLFMEMSAYHYEATNLIEYLVTAGVTGRRAANHGRIEGRGLEWSMQWRPMANLDVATNFSYVDNEDGEQMPLAGFAEKMAAVNVNYKPSEQSNINLFWQYTGEQNRAKTDLRSALPSSNWFSSRFSYQVLPEQLEVAFVVNNLFDQEADTPSNSIAEDYPTAGRQWLLQMNYQF